MIQIEELSASLEDYLEAIFHVVKEKQAARAKDIARKTGVNSSSVTGALRSLAEKGFINYAPYDIITLTSKGQKHAEDVVRRHEALKEFFTHVLCIEKDEAEKTACKMEHEMSRTVLDRIIALMEFIDVCPRAGESWLGRFGVRCESSDLRDECEKCLSTCLDDLKKRNRALSEEDEEGVLFSSLEKGQRGKIVKVRGRGGVVKQMRATGAGPGNIIEMEERDREADKVTVKVKGYRIFLTVDEASKIIVERL